MGDTNCKSVQNAAEMRQHQANQHKMSAERHAKRLKAKMEALQKMTEQRAHHLSEAQVCRRKALRHARNSSRNALAKLGPLWAPCTNRADRLAEAARAFLAAGRPELAAGAFSEATTVVGLVPQLVRENLPCDREPFLSLSPAWVMARPLREAEGHLRAHALSAARCWLMAASKAAQGNTAELREASAHFALSLHHWEAAQCAAFSGDFHTALGQLAHIAEAPEAFQLGLACASILGGAA